MDLQEIREKFSNDRFATDCLGAVVESVEGDEAVCSFEIGPQHRNAAGGVMGGALFTIADFAFAVATNHGGTLVVSAASTIEFIGGAKGSRVIARAVPDKIGRSLCFYTVRVEDDLGNLLAKVSITGKITSAKI
ncbi:MAG: PaaI family thioesterase [Coriobacteriales bacterium]|jgi:acyl-CoA thioesterase